MIATISHPYLPISLISLPVLDGLHQDYWRADPFMLCHGLCISREKRESARWSYGLRESAKDLDRYNC